MLFEQADPLIPALSCKDTGELSYKVVRMLGPAQTGGIGRIVDELRVANNPCTYCGTACLQPAPEAPRGRPSRDRASRPPAWAPPPVGRHLLAGGPGGRAGWRWAVCRSEVCTFCPLPVVFLAKQRQGHAICHDDPRGPVGREHAGAYRLPGWRPDDAFGRQGPDRPGHSLPGRPSAPSCPYGETWT